MEERDQEPDEQKWLGQAATGNLKAMYNLGLMHWRQSGLGTKEGLDQAEAWWRRAAEAGDGPAAAALGLLYMQVHRAAEAEPWLVRAVAAGDPRAAENLHVCRLVLGKSSGPATPR